MKKCVSLLLAGVCLLCLAGCESSIQDMPAPVQTTGIETDIQLPEPAMAAQYRVQYIRTNGGDADTLFPTAHILESVRQLQAYYTQNRERFFLERREQVYTDTTPGFLDACDGYDEAFFENSFLLFILLEEGSGSVRHEVSGVTHTPDGTLTVSVDRKVPECGTDDMAQWHIILELDREASVETVNDLRIYLDGQLVYSGDQIVPPSPPPARDEPPGATLYTPEGEQPLPVAGYSWLMETPEGVVAAIRDEAELPLLKSSLESICLDNKYAQSVFAPVQGSHIYAPTNSLGYLIKLDWEERPDSVTYACWSEAVWERPDTQEEPVTAHENFSFYAKPGGYIYEITATWADTGTGSYGTASYYVYIICGNTQEVTS